MATQRRNYVEDKGRLLLEFINNFITCAVSQKSFPIFCASSTAAQSKQPSNISIPIYWYVERF